METLVALQIAAIALRFNPLIKSSTLIYLPTFSPRYSARCIKVEFKDGTTVYLKCSGPTFAALQVGDKEIKVPDSVQPIQQLTGDKLNTFIDWVVSVKDL